MFLDALRTPFGVTTIGLLSVLGWGVILAFWFITNDELVEARRSLGLAEQNVRMLQRENARLDPLVHPETTDSVKWQKITKQTRDHLLRIYFENMDECNQHITEDSGVTIGESAIIHLITKYAQGQSDG